MRIRIVVALVAKLTVELMSVEEVVFTTTETKLDQALPGLIGKANAPILVDLTP